MGIRVQPLDIDVPSNDPFINDLLDRQESVEVLTNLVGSIEGPCAIAIDASWGDGKSTFLRLWSQYLRNKGFSVVKFNAWETDYSDDPFVTLSTELTGGLGNQFESSVKKKIEDAKRRAAEVVRNALPGIIRLGTAGILDVDSLLKGEIDNALTAYANKRISSYQDAKASIESFRKTLQEMANAISETRDGLPLVVMIDELDRCRPSYAVELLEIAKHLFLTDQMIFVVAINRSQLAHSIKALYGSDFDAGGYLQRFFDVDFQLPTPERNKFIQNTLVATGINDFFKRTKDQTYIKNSSLLQDMLTAFFADPELNLRQISQAIHHIGLVIGSLRSDHKAFLLTAVVALILRTIDMGLYCRFCRGEVMDLEVADNIFGRPGLASLRDVHEGHLFEAALIAGNHEISIANSIDRTPTDSLLLKKRKEKLETEKSEKPSRDKLNAGAVVRLVEAFLREGSFGGGVGFVHSVERIELLSTSLIDDNRS